MESRLEPDWPVEPAILPEAPFQLPLTDVTPKEFDIRLARLADESFPFTKVSNMTQIEVQAREHLLDIACGNETAVPLPCVDVSTIEEPTLKDWDIHQSYDGLVRDEQAMVLPIRAPEKVLKSSEAVPRIMTPSITQKERDDHRDWCLGQDTNRWPTCKVCKCPSQG